MIFFCIYLEFSIIVSIFAALFFIHKQTEPYERLQTFDTGGDPGA